MTDLSIEPDELRSAVATVFAARPDGVDLARRYAHHLSTSGAERGLIGPREVERLWDRHILNCAVVASLLRPGQQVVDVGSGAGLPGLAIAIARPDVAVVLVEPLERRVTWLAEVVADLGLGVRIVRARAEELRRHKATGPARSPDPVTFGAADVVTARAVAALPKLAGWCLPLLRPGGVLLALKGASAPAELEAADSTLRQLGAGSWEVVSVGGGVIPVPTTVVRVTLSSGRRTGRREELV